MYSFPKVRKGEGKEKAGWLIQWETTVYARLCTGTLPGLGSSVSPVMLLRGVYLLVGFPVFSWAQVCAENEMGGGEGTVAPGEPQG